MKLGRFTAGTLLAMTLMIGVAAAAEDATDGAAEPTAAIEFSGADIAGMLTSSALVLIDEASGFSVSGKFLMRSKTKAEHVIDADMGFNSRFCDESWVRYRHVGIWCSHARLVQAMPTCAS